MAYATREQIAARLPQVNGVGESSNFDATCNEALVWADDKINVGLSSKGAPFASPAPSSVSQCAADFAASFVARSTGNAADLDLAKELRREAEAALELMKQNGVPELLETPGEELPSAETVAYHSALGQTSEIAKINW